MKTFNLRHALVLASLVAAGPSAFARFDGGVSGEEIQDVAPGVRSAANGGMQQEFKEFCLEELPDDQLSIGAQEARKVCKEKATRHATRKITREFKKASIEAGAKAKAAAAKASVAANQTQGQAAKSVGDASTAGELAKSELASLNEKVIAEEKPDLAELGSRKDNLKEISDEYKMMAQDEKMQQQAAAARGNSAEAESHRRNFEKFVQFATNAAKLAAGIERMISARQAFHGQLSQDTAQQIAAAAQAGINAQQALQIAGQLNSMAGGGSGGGSSGGPIGADGSGVQTGSASIGSIAKNSSNVGSGTSGLNTGSSSMSDPANFFKNKSGSLASTNKVALGTPTTSASSSDVSEVLREQRATKANAAAAATAGANKNNTSLGTGAGALSQAGATSAGGGYDSGGGFSSADFGLSANLGDPGFDEKMKDLLGLGKEEGSLSEEEKALLQQSRNLASLSGEAKGLSAQGVLEADSVSLFDRTKNRITISLKRGHVTNGISAKLK